MYDFVVYLMTAKQEIMEGRAINSITFNIKFFMWEHPSSIASSTVWFEDLYQLHEAETLGVQNAIS